MQLCDEGVAEVYGVTGHGAHAKYMKCPARTLVTLPEELSFDAGAAHVLDPSQTNDVVGAIKDLTHGLGAHASLDASSSPQARREAVRCVRTWGKACFVGEGGEVTLDVSSDLLRRQVTLIGSWTFSTAGQAECAQYIADRGIDVDKLFTETWKLDQAVEAYQLFDKQNSGKGVFHP
jgi:threonine dehydrogenase-like Zn-dependent dehydrogenase